MTVGAVEVKRIIILGKVSHVARVLCLTQVSKGKRREELVEGRIIVSIGSTIVIKQVTRNAKYRKPKK